MKTPPFFQASEDRLELVATFAVSALASNFERMGKPFNPLLGETYELTRNDFRIVCEQVGHHPPVSAWHATGKDGRWFHELSLNTNLRISSETEFVYLFLCTVEVEKIFKGSLGSIPSPSPSVKIQNIGGKVYLR